MSIKTENVGKMSAAQQRDLTVGWLFAPEVITNGEIVDYPDDVERPKTRADCEGQEGPCPFVSCSQHLYLDVMPNGSVKINFPGVELEDMPATCALSVADSAQSPNGVSLDELARVTNLSIDRAFQVVEEAKKRLRANAEEMGITADLLGIRIPDGARARTRGDGRFVDAVEKTTIRKVG